MSKSLCWKVTPKPEINEFESLYRSTWNTLASIRDIDPDRINEMEITLTEENITELKTILATAQQSNNKELTGDMKELIAAIKKHESITLFVQ